MKEKAIYVLGIPPFSRILHGLEFENKKEAQRRAREENRIGEYRGRGVKVYKLSDFDTTKLSDPSWFPKF